jgi:L,D-transpeptidase ErfK/SrfK
MMSEIESMIRPRIDGRTCALLGALALGTSAALTLGLAPMGTANADSFRLSHPGDSVIGTPFYVKTRHEDTLIDFARQNGQGYDDLKYANPKVDMWVPGEGAEALIPTFWVLPNAPRNGIVINRAEKRLYYFPSETPDEVQTFAISIGREGWDTPLGSFHIKEKIDGPTWTPPASIRAEHAANGDPLPAVVPAGPDNPLGLYAMRLSDPSYLIHSTNKPWGLGMQVSHGCIRMYPEGIAELFKEVSVSTPVTIVDQPYKLGWLGDDLYLEVHVDKPEKKQGPRSVIPDALASADGVEIDWEAVSRTLNENTGLPQLVGGRRSSAGKPYLDMIF